MLTSPPLAVLNRGGPRFSAASLQLTAQPPHRPRPPPARPDGSSTVLLATIHRKNCDLVFVVVHDEEESDVAISDHSGLDLNGTGGGCLVTKSAVNLKCGCYVSG